MKLFKIDQLINNLQFEIDNIRHASMDQDKVKTIVITELNNHSQLVNENMKQNLGNVKKESEIMVRKLGNNLQEALTKIKDDLQYETKDLIAMLEDKLNSTLRIVTEDTNKFGLKWDKELQKFQVLMNKKVEDNESVAKKEYSRMLDEMMDNVENTLNQNVVGSLRALDKAIKDH